jgi:diaminopimelate epimerase
VIYYTIAPDGTAQMKLINTDGSPSELSGNGLRCLAAHVARVQGLTPGAVVEVETGAGTKTLDLVSQAGARYTFRAAMGQPEDLRETELVAAGDRARLGLRMGNPQGIARHSAGGGSLNRLGSALATHGTPPAPTSSSSRSKRRISVDPDLGARRWPDDVLGHGSSASAVAAAAHGVLAATEVWPLEAASA